MGGELPPTGARQRSVRSRLLAAGFQDSERARACLEDAALRELLAVRRRRRAWARRQWTWSRPWGVRLTRTWLC